MECEHLAIASTYSNELFCVVASCVDCRKPGILHSPECRNNEFEVVYDHAERMKHAL